MLEAEKRLPQYEAVGRVGIDAAVLVLVCLTPPGTGASLFGLKEGAHMGRETSRAYMCWFLNDFKSIYGAMYLIWRQIRAEMGCIASRYAEVGFSGCICDVNGAKLEWKKLPLRLRGAVTQQKG